MMEIMPGIYQLRLPMGDFPPGYVNTYLVQGASERDKYARKDSKRD